MKKIELGTKAKTYFHTDFFVTPFSYKAEENEPEGHCSDI